MRRLLHWLILAFGLAATGAAQAGTLQDGAVVHFDHILGLYSKGQYTKDFGVPVYAHMERAEIVALSPSHKALRVVTPGGAWGATNSGAALKTQLPGCDAYSLAYQVRFGETDSTGFDFNKGGKLPGLCGGRCNTGGKRPTGDGWSARYMWRPAGQLVIYLYHVDQQRDYGDDLPLHVTVELGKWYTLKQYIKLNTNDLKNGVLQVWVNDQLVLDRDDLRYRLGDQAPIDHFLCSHFFGGHDASWAPRIASAIYFNAFRVSHEACR